jgi:hypothetical protein
VLDFQNVGHPPVLEVACRRSKASLWLLDESLGTHAQQHTLGPPTYAELRAFA